MKLKNVPNNIFLNIGYEPEKGDDFNDLGEVTWCADKVNDNDIEYQRKPIWHDLKKKPNDFPKTENDILIVVKIKKELLYFTGYYLDRFHLDGYAKSSFSDNVIAWMDIPKFKY